MSYLGNSPVEQTVLRVEARKSFSLAIHITNFNGAPLDITDCTLSLVAKRQQNADDPADDANLIENATAELVDPEQGYARFNIQASDLDHEPGEYPFAIVLIDQGYSAVIVKGVLDLQPNTEWASTTATYTGVNPPTGLTVALRSRQVLSVRTGPILPPGTTTFSEDDKAKLDTIEEGAQVHIPADWEAGPMDPGYIFRKPVFGTAAFENVEDIALPSGGRSGNVITKIGPLDSDIAWQEPQVSAGGSLDAAGVPAGHAPVASGADSWSWGEIEVPVTSVNSRIGDVELNLDDVPDTATRVALTSSERTKLSGLTPTPEWSAVANKPAFGELALLNESDVLQPGGVTAADISSGTIAAARLPKVTGLSGITSGTANPSGGADGDLYIQYT